MSNRRRFILGTLGATGALALGWTLLPPRQRLAPSQPIAAPDAQRVFNGWVRLGSDGAVVVMVPKSEMGQGVLTSLALVLAEELDADWSRVSVAHPPPDKIYNNLATVVDSLPFHPDDDGALKRSAGWLTAKAMREMGVMVTGGSSSVKDLWLPLRRAGASARAMLVDAAAQQWNVPADECRTAAGEVLHASSGRRASYGALAAAASQLPLPRKPALKQPKDFKLIGRSHPRLDSAAKSTGQARFGIDALPPGTVYASVQMSPVLGGRVASFEAQAVTSRPGVLKVLAFEGDLGGSGGVAVIANAPWRAIQAARALPVQWQGGAADFDSVTAMPTLLAAAARGDGFTYFSRGDAEAALKSAARTVVADFSAPLLAHTTMEPMNCTVLAEPARATVWVPTQVPGLARRAVARALQLPEEAVTVHVTLLGGGFGRRLDVDFVAQAATIARALPGKPVQTLWTREEDTRHDFYRPPAVARLQAGLDERGALVAWLHHSAGPSIVHGFLARQWDLPAAGPDKTTIEGAFDQPYEMPAMRVAHEIVPLPVPIGFWRSVGHSHQAFFKECFLDEVAAAAGTDPVAFRLGLLQHHPRHAAVLRRAAELAGWGQALGPTADGARRARGVALHQSFGSIVAQVAEVSLGADQRIRVHRVVAVIDCGFAVHPDGVKHQLESAIIYGLSAALHGEITVRKGQVQQGNFNDYPALRLADCPEIVTDIIASAEHPEGVGEPGTPPIAPAVANAVAVLTGQRLRRLPLRVG